jgi:hypothetical protein
MGSSATPAGTDNDMAAGTGSTVNASLFVRTDKVSVTVTVSPPAVDVGSTAKLAVTVPTASMLQLELLIIRKGPVGVNWHGREGGGNAMTYPPPTTLTQVEG